MYINARYESDLKEETYKRYMAHTLYLTKQGIRYEEKYKSYEQLVNAIKPQKESDTRNSSQIYEDTMNLFKRE